MQNDPNHPSVEALSQEERATANKALAATYRDAILFRFWCRASSYPWGWPVRLRQLFAQEQRLDGAPSPASYRRALMRLAKEKGINLP